MAPFFLAASLVCAACHQWRSSCAATWNRAVLRLCPAPLPPPRPGCQGGLLAPLAQRAKGRAGLANAWCFSSRQVVQVFLSRRTTKPQLSFCRGFGRGARASARIGTKAWPGVGQSGSAGPCPKVLHAPPGCRACSVRQHPWTLSALGTQHGRPCLSTLSSPSCWGRLGNGSRTLGGGGRGRRRGACAWTLTALSFPPFLPFSFLRFSALALGLLLRSPEVPERSLACSAAARAALWDRSLARNRADSLGGAAGSGGGVLFRRCLSTRRWLSVRRRRRSGSPRPGRLWRALAAVGLGLALVHLLDLHAATCSMGMCI